MREYLHRRWKWLLTTLAIAGTAVIVADLTKRVFILFLTEPWSSLATLLVWGLYIAGVTFVGVEIRYRKKEGF